MASYFLFVFGFNRDLSANKFRYFGCQAHINKLYLQCVIFAMTRNVHFCQCHFSTCNLCRILCGPLAATAVYNNNCSYDKNVLKCNFISSCTHVLFSTF